MPFARFEKLAPEKREHLLEVAAREFAIYGFADASINRILEQAQMSKGATYYTVIRTAAQGSLSRGEREPLIRLAQQIRTSVLQLIQRGQDLGVIRADLPSELLFAWLLALDRASDHWLLDHWERLDRAEMARLSDQTVAAMRRAVAPAEGEPARAP